MHLPGYPLAAERSCLWPFQATTIRACHCATLAVRRPVCAPLIHYLVPWDDSTTFFLVQPCHHPLHQLQHIPLAMVHIGLPPAQSGCLPHSSYPHLFDSILSYADRDALLKLRGTGRQVCDQVDHILAHHVRLTAVYNLKNMPRDAVRLSFCDPKGSRIPAFWDLYKHQYRMKKTQRSYRASASNAYSGGDASVAHNTDNKPPRDNLSRIKVLDVPDGPVLIALMDNNFPRMPNLETARYYSEAMYSLHYLDMDESISTGATNLIVFVDCTREQECIWFKSCPDGEHPIWVPKQTRRLVLNLRYNTKEMLLFDAALFIAERPELQEIVFTVTTTSLWSPAKAKDFAWRLCDTFSSDILRHSVACTIVGVPDVIGTADDNPDAARTAIKNAIRTNLEKDKGWGRRRMKREGPRLDIEAAMANVHFYTLEEYASMISPEQFRLETVQ